MKIATLSKIGKFIAFSNWLAFIRVRKKLAKRRAIFNKKRWKFDAKQ